MAHVQLKDVTKLFPVKVNGTLKTIRALNGVSFEVADGEIVALTGPSGCGKTTALRIIMGLDTATSGTVLVDGKPVTGCGYDRGMVFQHAELLPWLSALDNVKFGLRMKGVTEPKLTKTADRYLDLVGLGEARHQRPHQLSGGMKQRVGIARALAIDPKILLLDEPFGSLDAQTRENQQIELLSIHKKTGKTIIFVTHDLDEAVFLADRVVVMSMGRVRDTVPINLGQARDDVRTARGSDEYAKKRALIWEMLHEAPPATPAAHGAPASEDAR